MTLDELGPELAYLLPRTAMIDAEIERRRLGTEGKTLANFKNDPYGHVIWAYPWGLPGPLQEITGPRKWQADYLKDLGRMVAERAFNGRDAVAPIRMAVTAGKGPGKSALMAWLAIWIRDTRPGCQGTVTANTYQQLRTKTWASIQYWSRIARTSKDFIVTSDQMRHIREGSAWQISAQNCDPSNAEAYAGQHAARSSSVYFFDEASRIADIIFRQAEGGLVDGHPFFFVFGNCTRNSGAFYRICFGSEQKYWDVRRIDVRETEVCNPALLAQWIDMYGGEDSDRFRVDVCGLPPNADDLQFIDTGRVREAQKREVHPLADEPLVAGLDISGGGRAWNVLRFRRGTDARTVPPIRLKGEVGREVVIAKCAEVLRESAPEKRVAALFVDAGVFGSPIAERLKMLGFDNVYEINFGDTQTPDPHCLNMRSYMWKQMKDGLATCGIPANDEKLEMDLTSPGFKEDRMGKLVLESKEDMQKRGVASPDDGDALCLTWARRVAPLSMRRNYELKTHPW